MTLNHLQQPFVWVVKTFFFIDLIKLLPLSIFTPAFLYLFTFRFIDLLFLCNNFFLKNNILL